MSSRFAAGRLLAASTAAVLLIARGTLAAEPFSVTSPAYKDGDIWPSKFAGSDPSRTNPPCPGENISPPLTWSNAPAATKSFAILMYDPDGGNGLGAVHWVAYNIPASKTSLAEGEPANHQRTGRAERTTWEMTIISGHAAPRAIRSTITSSRLLPPISSLENSSRD
jgi:phosphatidylethanolamine-binding protein (PEBP) family uncharacterized protein